MQLLPFLLVPPLVFLLLILLLLVLLRGSRGSSKGSRQVCSSSKGGCAVSRAISARLVRQRVLVPQGMLALKG
jgi:hypothetical protein